MVNPSSNCYAAKTPESTKTDKLSEESIPFRSIAIHKPGIYGKVT